MIFLQHSRGALLWPSQIVEWAETARETEEDPHGECEETLRNANSPGFLAGIWSWQEVEGFLIRIPEMWNLLFSTLFAPLFRDTSRRRRTQEKIDFNLVMNHPPHKKRAHVSPTLPNSQRIDGQTQRHKQQLAD